MSAFWISLVGILNKIAPFLIAGLAYLKGKADHQKDIDNRNLEKQVEYGKIDADKPDTIDDDLDRLRQGTY